MRIEREHIHAYVPIADLTQSTPFFRQEDFHYDAQRDVYVCPAGKELHFCQRQTTERSRRYRAHAKDCNHCPLQAKCTTSKQGRSLCRSVWVEPLFAEAKDWHGLRRFRLRELWRVNCEALRIAAGQNLKRLLKKRGWGRRPFPAEAMYASFWGLLRGVLGLFLKEGSFLVLRGSASPIVRTPCVSLC